MSSSVPLAQSSDTGNGAVRKPISRKRIEANRRSALRSTGPRTAEGKRTASHNAIKHGLLAREVVIKAGDGEENLQEFDELLERLWEDCCPVRVVEEMLVQKIATCWWRLARVLRAENGEVCKRANSAAVEHHLRRSNELHFNLISENEGEENARTEQSDEEAKDAEGSAERKPHATVHWQSNEDFGFAEKACVRKHKA